MYVSESVMIDPAGRAETTTGRRHRQRAAGPGSVLPDRQAQSPPPAPAAVQQPSPQRQHYLHHDPASTSAAACGGGASLSDLPPACDAAAAAAELEAVASRFLRSSAIDVGYRAEQRE